LVNFVEFFAVAYVIEYIGEYFEKVEELAY
jgi:hypothetical protein